MKKFILGSSVLICVGVFGIPNHSSADEVTGQTKNTPTTVTVKDSDNGGNDPLDPTDPTQTHLTLETVPDSYNFETAVKNVNYNLAATLTDQNVTVFNDRTARDWSVKASLVGNNIKRGTDSFDVTSFKINETEIAATGATGIVASSPAGSEKTSQNNTGNIATAIKNISISFVDPANTIKTGNELTGQVTYQLYSTIDAK